MAPPSYARATASSTSKASPRPSKTVKDADTRKPAPSGRFEKPAQDNPWNKETACPNQKPPTRPSKPGPGTAPEKKKSLKRPSLLTSHQKNTMTCKRDLQYINPRDPSKPCLLATLPSELRAQIYAYVFPSTQYFSPSWAAITKHKQHVPPALVSVSRAVRLEASYTYYTTTRFHFSVRNVDFAPVMRWLEHAGPQHRAWLARNRNAIVVNVLPGVKNTHTYPPRGWLLDAPLEHHWRACQPFGNIYTVPGDGHKMHFVVFCRLAEWWRWRARNAGLRCDYRFEQSPFANPFGMPDLHDEAVLRGFLRNHGLVGAMPCVDKAWTRNRGAGVTKAMRAEGVRFLDALDQWYRDRWGAGKDGANREWDWGIEEAKEAMERW